MTERDPIQSTPPGFAGPIVIGAAIAVLGLGGFLWWAMTAPLSSAAIAPGVVVVESTRRTIQHLEGGIAAEILVEEGQAVTAGQVVLRVANGAEAARLEQLIVREAALLAERSRLTAELSGQEKVTFPDTLLPQGGPPRSVEAIAVQRALFTARREGLAQSRTIARSALEQSRQEMRGLDAQIEARGIERAYLRDRIAGLERISGRGFAPAVQIDELSAQLARLDGDLAQLAAARAAAEARAEQRRQEFDRIATERAAEVAGRLQTVERELAEVREARIAAADVMRRTDILAPTGGRVMGLAVTAPGTVIRSGETLMEIVPEDDELRVEVRIDPGDVDVVHGGLPVQIRLTAYSFRHTLPVSGTLEQISPDRIVDARTGAASYLGIVRFADDDLATRAADGIAPYPGMAAEVVIQTGERTLMDYLLDPILKPMSRAFREG